ncbi:MAG: c-type cytochrome [Planctomycetota bacterium]|nr:c-type cytochrome [Planctomycetota bacterium]
MYRNLAPLLCLAGSLLWSSTRESLAEEPTDPASIRRPKGFHVERIRSADEGEDSWISLCFDDRGRIILGLDRVGVARITLGKKEHRFERLEKTLKHCRGVLFAHGSIYVNSTDSRKLVRLDDRNGDDRYATSVELMQFDYRSRYGHGSNQMRLGPDGMIYLMVGNDVAFPAETMASSPYRNPENDWLIPQKRDLGQDERVGFLLRMDRNGGQREVIAGGFRNQVDMAFGPHGEMFTFDADMEWDIGTPWYRPIRINHVVSGGEYGWRWGSGKWPAYYPDSLPSNLDVGMGSPTGVVFGTGSEFPERYQKALFLADWQNGRIFAAHRKSQGGSYVFELESFLNGAPLNVCDMEFGPDGKLYFITGGRGSRSALYRVSWEGDPVSSTELEPLNQLQKRRREIEDRYHRKRDPGAIEDVWEDLFHPDPWVRNAARVAVERQPLEQWKQKALGEKGERALHALLPLVRCTPSNDSSRETLQRGVIERLCAAVKKLESSKRLTPHHLLSAIRTCGILFARHGNPAPESADRLIAVMGSHFPASQESVNCELFELLVFLGHPEAVEPALGLLEDEGISRETQIHLARSLLHVADSLNAEQKKRYVLWLSRSESFRGGHLLPKVLVQMRTDFFESLNPDETKRLQSLVGNDSRVEKSGRTQAPRKFVRSWTLDSVSKLDFEKGDPGRGRRIYVQAECSNCHRKDDAGGQIGPDLTNVHKRYSRTGILESILQPSRQIDPKYALSSYELLNGKSYTGRVHGVNAKTITLEVDPILQTTVVIQRDEIERTRRAPRSPMPSGLLDTFSRQEIVDLMAYLGAD